MKISFKNDYAEGAHPMILEALMCTNTVQQAKEVKYQNGNSVQVTNYIDR